MIAAAGKKEDEEEGDDHDNEEGDNLIIFGRQVTDNHPHPVNVDQHPS